MLPFAWIVVCSCFQTCESSSWKTSTCTWSKTVPGSRIFLVFRSWKFYRWPTTNSQRFRYDFSRTIIIQLSLFWGLRLRFNSDWFAATCLGFQPTDWITQASDAASKLGSSPCNKQQDNFHSWRCKFGLVYRRFLLFRSVCCAVSRIWNSIEIILSTCLSPCFTVGVIVSSTWQRIQDCSLIISP